MNTRRAYALAMVMLLGTVCIFGVAAVLERATESGRAGKRAVDSYLRHHEQAGLRDIIGLALSFRGLNVGDLKPEASTKMNITVEGSGEVEVRVADGQGTLLLASGEGVADVLRAAADQLSTLDPQGTATGKNTRERGPAKVSINSAPRAVLTALFKAVDAQGPAEAFASAALEKRADQRLTSADVGAMLQTAGADEEVRKLVEGLLTTEPGLFKVRVESRGPGGRVGARFEGLIQGDPRGGAAGSQWAFLTWTRLEDDQQWTPDDALDAGER
ncbi:MAG: hypothetical protein ACKVS8_10470 [Phycisphaerales bacterium]